MTTAQRNTNTTTHFLRDSRALHMIRDLVAGPNTRAGRRTVVWSVGCSSGEEPYGLAMLCREVGASIEVVATDINPDILERARRGLYKARSLRHVDEHRRQRWFRRDGEDFQVVDEIRECVTFRHHDVIRDAVVRHDVDVVLCRNVMVYFHAEHVRRALSTIVASLRPGALFIPSASEWLRSDLRARDSARLIPMEKAGVIVYQRVDDASGIPCPVAASAIVLAAAPAPQERRAAPAPVHRGPVDAVEAFRRAGDHMLDLGRPGDARELYQSAVTEAPLLADLHLRIALCHLNTHDPKSAREAVRRALFLTPELWPAWLLLADLSNEATQTRHCLDQARVLLEAAQHLHLDDDPVLRPFATDRRVALDAIRRRLRGQS